MRKEKVFKQNKFSICFFCHSSENGGAQKILFKLIEDLNNKNMDVFVVLPKAGPFINYLQSININYKIIPYKLWLNNDNSIFRITRRVIWNFLLVIPYTIFLNKYKFDIIYTNTSTVSVGAFIAKILRIPHIWHFREFGFEDHGYTYDLGYWLSGKLTNFLSTLCLVNSKAVFKKYVNFVDKKKLFLIYEAYTETDLPGEGLKSFNNIDIPDFKCVIVGTLHRGKGHVDAIKSLAILLKKGYKISLLIVGDGDQDYKKELENIIKNNHLEKHVYFFGHLNNPREIMKISDIFLMCSKSEAFGLVTLEALEIGLPVIGTNSGGTVEIIEENINGLLYSSGNQIELASKIEYLYLNPQVRSKMAYNAKSKINHKFSPDEYLNKSLQMIYKAIG